jgi:glycosyltransferase involved in cell wall biosynthesis
VIDGGSTDGSLEVIKAYDDRLAFWASESDHGQVDAINKGFARASGEIIAWINSDDVLLPGAVSGAVQAFKEHPEAGLVYANGMMVDAELTLLDRHYYRTLDVVDLLSFEIILQPGSFMRREVLSDVGVLNDAYNLILDHELWVRIAARYPLHHIDRFWSLERTHQQAKTIALAREFVSEARDLIAWAEKTPELADTVRENRKRIQAGLRVFSARRLIDAGEYQTAFQYMMQALTMHPSTVAKYWYKVVQAGLSAIGLAGWFVAYRNSRRAVQYRGEVVDYTKPYIG